MYQTDLNRMTAGCDENVTLLNATPLITGDLLSLSLGITFGIFSLWTQLLKVGRMAMGQSWCYNQIFVHQILLQYKATLYSGSQVGNFIEIGYSSQKLGI